jgi:WD40 repeat protein
MSTGGDGTSRIWDVESGKSLGKYSRYTYFSPDGKKIVTTELKEPKSVTTIFDVDSGKVLHEFENKGKSSYGAFSPDGKRIIIRNVEEKIVYFLDVETGKISQTFEGYADAVFSPDGKKFALTDNYYIADDRRKTAKTLCIFDAETQKELQKIESDKGIFNGAFFSPDGKKIVTTGEERINGSRYYYIVRVWDVETGKVLHKPGQSIDGDIGGSDPTSFSPDGKKLFLPDNEGVLIYNFDSKKKLLLKLNVRDRFDYEDMSRTAKYTAFSSDGKQFF